jgi:hypothetical protein
MHSSCLLCVRLVFDKYVLWLHRSIINISSKVEKLTTNSRSLRGKLKNRGSRHKNRDQTRTLDTCGWMFYKDPSRTKKICWGIVGKQWRSEDRLPTVPTCPHSGSFGGVGVWFPLILTLCINYNYILHLCPQRRQLFCFSLLSREYYLHHLLDSWWIALLWIVSLYCLRICIICVIFIMNSEGVKVSWEWEQKEHFVQWAQSSITMDHFFQFQDNKTCTLLLNNNSNNLF